MSAIAAAVERGKQATRKKSQYVPIGVRWQGRLIAEVRDESSGEIEGIYREAGKWAYRRLLRRADGTTDVADVRGKELRRVAEAMIGSGATDLDELVEECFGHFRDQNQERLRSNGNGNGRRRRRGRS